VASVSRKVMRDIAGLMMHPRTTAQNFSFSPKQSLAPRRVRWRQRRWTGWGCIWRREGHARSRRHNCGDRISFRVHTLDVGDVVLGLERLGSDLVLRIGAAPGILGLKDVHRFADGREREHAGSRRDTGTGAEEAHPEEQSPPLHMHRVSPDRAVEEVGAHRPALSQHSLCEAQSEKRVWENQGLASPNFPVFGNLRQSPERYRDEPGAELRPEGPDGPGSVVP